MPGFHRIRPPRKRRISVKALVYAVAGAEPRRVAYRGSRPGTEKYERANHNPFFGLDDVEDPDLLLLEGGGAYLLETGDEILLEAA